MRRVDNRLNVGEQSVIPYGAFLLGIQKFLLQIENSFKMICNIKFTLHYLYLICYTLYVEDCIKFWHRSFTFNSNKSPT